jgi:hypothetical protein
VDGWQDLATGGWHGMQRAMTGCIAGRLNRPSSEDKGRNSSKEPGNEDISEKV